MEPNQKYIVTYTQVAVQEHIQIHTQELLQEHKATTSHLPGEISAPIQAVKDSKKYSCFTIPQWYLFIL